MRFRVAQPWCAAAARAPSLAPTFSSPRSLWASILRRSEEHTSELQSQSNLVCRLLLEKKKQHLSDLPPRPYITALSDHFPSAPFHLAKCSLHTLLPLASLPRICCRILTPLHPLQQHSD